MRKPTSEPRVTPDDPLDRPVRGRGCAPPAWGLDGAPAGCRRASGDPVQKPTMSIGSRCVRHPDWGCRARQPGAAPAGPPCAGGRSWPSARVHARVTRAPGVRLRPSAPLWMRSVNELGDNLESLVGPPEAASAPAARRRLAGPGRGVAGFRSARYPLAASAPLPPEEEACGCEDKHQDRDHGPRLRRRAKRPVTPTYRRTARRRGERLPLPCGNSVGLTGFEPATP
jgi:hypothetical protein